MNLFDLLLELTRPVIYWKVLGNQENLKFYVKETVFVSIRFLSTSNLYTSFWEEQ